MFEHHVWAMCLERLLPALEHLIFSALDVDLDEPQRPFYGVELVQPPRLHLYLADDRLTEIIVPSAQTAVARVVGDQLKGRGPIYIGEGALMHLHLWILLSDLCRQVRY